MQKAAVREDPGSFREDKREGETAKKQFLSKAPQSGKIREEKREGETTQKLFLSKHRNPGRSGKIPGSETGRETPTFRKPAVREVPGRFREGFREGVGALKSCFYAVSLRFPDTIFPQSGPCVYGKQKGGTREVTNDVFLPDGPGIHFPGEKPCGRNRGFSSVSLARF